jgi:uncharacterized protein YndB with AHSA1/START domain
MPEIMHQLRIEAPPERVYRAVTEQQGLVNWWTRDTKAEPTAGSVAEFGFNKRGTVFRMKITRLDRPRLVQWTCLGEHQEWEATRISFELTPDGEGTVLLFHHLGWLSTDGILPMCSFDWAMYLMSLRDYLETGRGRPHTG